MSLDAPRGGGTRSGRYAAPSRWRSSSRHRVGPRSTRAARLEAGGRPRSPGEVQRGKAPRRPAPGEAWRGGDIRFLTRCFSSILSNDIEAIFRFSKTKAHPPHNPSPKTTPKTLVETSRTNRVVRVRVITPSRRSALHDSTDDANRPASRAECASVLATGQVCSSPCAPCSPSAARGCARLRCSLALRCGAVAPRSCGRSGRGCLRRGLSRFGWGEGCR